MVSKKTIRKCVLSLIVGTALSTIYAVSSAQASQPVVSFMASSQLTSPFSLTPASFALSPIKPILPVKPIPKHKPKDTAIHIATVMEKPVDYAPSTPTPILTQTSVDSAVTPTQPIQSTTTAAVPQNSGGLNPELIFAMVNQFREDNGLPAFEENDQVCSLAASRAPEIAGEIASGHMHAGMYARNLPYWNTENIITMRSEAEAVKWWENDYIHRVQMLGNFKYSCVACSGNACAEEFTNLTPK